MEINKYISEVSILLTGCLGEMWYPGRLHRPGYVDSELKRWDLGNHGLSEVRLVSGFIQLPLPYIGARRREDIFRITESLEMNPWRLGTLYDRPIPRRVAEEAGVPREFFGQKKMAAVAEFPPPHIPHNPQLREEFSTFLAENGLLPKWKFRLFPVVHYINSAVTFRGIWKRYQGLYYLERLISKIIKRKYKFPRLWNHLKGSVFCLCVNKRVGDYRKIMNGFDLHKNVLGERTK